MHRTLTLAYGRLVAIRRSLGRCGAVDRVTVVVDVCLALVLPGRVRMWLVLVADRRVVVPVRVGRQLVLEVTAVSQVMGDVHVLMLVHDSIMVMRIHVELLPFAFRQNIGRSSRRQ
jgi:hypothetical protein